jgi:hypothetical protein
MLPTVLLPYLPYLLLHVPAITYYLPTITAYLLLLTITYLLLPACAYVCNILAILTVHPGRLRASQGHHSR